MEKYYFGEVMDKNEGILGANNCEMEKRGHVGNRTEEEQGNVNQNELRKSSNRGSEEDENHKES
jgi:hypothetical protein